MEISQLRIFALAKFRERGFSLLRNFASVDAKFRQDDREISFDLTKIRERFDEISWRNFVEFLRDQRTKNTEFRLHFFCTVLYKYWELFFHRAANYFLAVSRIYFWAYNALRALQLKWTDSSLWLPWATILKTLEWRSAFKENAKVKHCQGKKRKRFSSFFQNLSGTSSLCVNDEVFWTEDLIEETTKRLHDSYTILTLIEHDMPAQLNSSLPNLIPRVLVPYYTCWLSERGCCQWKCLLPRTSGRIFRF